MKQISAAAFFCALATPSLSAHPPELYFYPPPAIFENGYKIWSPLTLRADQITTQFPEISEMSGVGLIIYWSTICPKEGQYDFSIIDQALSYWGAKGKKVVLSVATMGFPIRNAEGGLESATPEWVMKRVATYQDETMVIPDTHDKQKAQAVTTFPSCFDPQFIEETRKLVETLGKRYDGNPALATVRIGTGMLGEDNLEITFEGVKSAIPGWSKIKWVNYCREVTNIYVKAFPKSQLEFDEGLVPVIEVVGTQGEQEAARAFMQSLNERHIFLAFDGLCAEDYPLWQARNSGKLSAWHQCIVTDLLNLQQAKARGCLIGLEALGPFTGSTMQDVSLIADMVKALQPHRLLLFPEVPMLLRYKRAGVKVVPLECVTNEVPAEAISPTTEHIEQLFKLLGYE